MLKCVIQIALGEGIDTTARQSKVAGVQFVTPETYDRAAAHFDRLRGDSRVERMDLQPKPDGAHLRSSLDRLGYCLASAVTRKELLTLLDF